MVDVKNMKFLKKNNFTKISGDASFRTFYRGDNSILVFSKKDKNKNLLVYDSVNKILLKNNIPAPKLIKENYNQNYIEIEDLGKVQALKIIKSKKNKKRFFLEIVKVLIKLQKIKDRKVLNFYGKKYKIPPYDKKKIFAEAKLFVDWFIPFNIKKLDNSKNRKKFEKIINKLISKLKISKKVLVHRDFHVSNIMYFKKKMYLIDSQDAVIGNIAYDLASLIDDVRYKTNSSLKREIYNYYINKNKNKVSHLDFKNDFEILSVLRNLKIIGIFTRLAKRDNKKKYLKMIPYCWKLIQNRIIDNVAFQDLKLFLKKKEFKKYIKF